MSEMAARGNAHLINNRLADAIDAYSRAIEECGATQLSLLLCNRALAYFKLDMLKHCVRDCDRAIESDSNCLRAYLRKGHALYELQRVSDAIEVWKSGSERTTAVVDMEIQQQLAECARTGKPPGLPLAIQQPPTIDTTKASAIASPPTTSTPSHQTPASEPVTVASTFVTKSAPTVPSPDAVSATAMVAARGMVQFGVGDKSIDERIALGYLQVNTGNFKQAIRVFDELLSSNNKLVAAYLGRGTAYALIGELPKAVRDFTQAIDVDRRCADAWKRRGQARAAMGDDTAALIDLTRAIELLPDSDTYHQRGLVYYKQHNYRRALADFQEAARIDPTNKLSWNHAGLCLNAIGQSVEAIQAHRRALDIDGQFKEAWANLGQAHKELGDYPKAEEAFARAIAIDPAYIHGYHLRSLARFGAGRHVRALADLEAAVAIEPANRACRHMKAVVEHGLGRLKEALADYQAVLAAEPDHAAFYQRELALFYHHHLDVPLLAYCFDAALDPYFKEAWCKRLPPSTALPNYRPLPPPSPTIADVDQSRVAASEDILRIVAAAAPFGPKLQLHTPGYLPNARQHRMCGLAILEMAQALQQVWRANKPVIVDGQASSGTRRPHPFGWRDLYDIGVRWRQVSEPNDPVWWVDQLSPEQFAEGYGSHTPMITGQTHVVRYYPMFPRALAIMKALLLEHGFALDEEAKNRIRNAQNCKALHDVLKRDFWVVTPCYSTARPGHCMEGTRITLQVAQPEGFEYSIRTPGTPPRWAEYDAELAFVFSQIQKEATRPNRDLDKLSDLFLTMTFYWYNFMPLSRGTAAVGYIALLGMFLSVGIDISTTIPKGVQVDWEGILRPRPQEFIDAIKPWMYPARTPTNVLDSLPPVREVIPTLRSMIVALNVEL